MQIFLIILVVVLAIAVGFLLRTVAGNGRAIGMQDGHIKRLEALNRFYLDRSQAAGVLESGAVDDGARIKHAITCGYIGALSTHEITEDRTKREAALRASLEYFTSTEAAVVSQANH